MTETIGYNDTKLGLLFFILLLLPIVLTFMAPVIATMTVFVITLWSCRKPLVVTERVYVNKPVTTHRTIKKKPKKQKNLMRPAKPAKPAEPKDPDFFGAVVAGLHSLGMKKNEAKKLAKKIYKADLHFDAESLLKDCLSQL